MIALPQIRRLKQIIRSAKQIVLTKLIRTQKTRWAKVASAGRPPWDERNVVLGSLVAQNSRVLDVGSGAQTLRKHLHESCSYQPCDVIPSSPDVIVFDFNSGEKLSLPTRYDVIVCSGVLEYIHSPGPFLRNVSSLGSSTLLTYNPLLPSQTRLERLANNWVNHLTARQLGTLFEECQLQSTLLVERENGELIFRLARAIE